ncbi:YfjI family protein [Providencia stuartii]|uniref:YfjI family protein n=1 Tax=Providencia stuartii TaxID=588 RepID=UPI0028867E3C|nr:YfjI family protein [Providencia stuartii]MDT1065155.1 YfjI family protein [Providencia stuartii]
MSHFPLNAFPSLIRDIIHDVHGCTQAPVPLIASSVISAMSLSCQGLINVRVNQMAPFPVSLFLLVIANSGERKTTVDKIVMKPFYQHDTNSLREFEQQKTDYSLEMQVWKEKEKAFLSQIRKKATQRQSTEETLKELKALQVEKPVQPKHHRYIYNNVTPEALQMGMFNNYPHIGLIADEGANILDRQIMKDLSFINSMWDGVSFHVDRKTTPSFTIEDGRITLSVMVQKKPFDLYLKRQGNKARGSGFFARCLAVNIDENLTTQGERFIRYQNSLNMHLNYLHCRINELLAESNLNEKIGKKICLSLDSSAQYEWEQIYNSIESRLKPEEEYASMKDFASKLANNIARLAAVFSYFIEGNCEIKKGYIDSASIICEWYMQQAIHLFGHEDGYYEALLLSWLHREYYQSGRMRGSIRFNDIRRYGPSALRKGKLLEAVISNLEKENAVYINYSLRGAKFVNEGERFNNNIFTKHPAYSFYPLATAATVATNRRV